MFEFSHAHVRKRARRDTEPSSDTPSTDPMTENREQVDVHTPETIAAMLDGCEYRDMCPQPAGKMAAADGLVIVYGYSDDLLEFDGAIVDELSAWGGTTAYLTDAGLVTNECDNYECPHYAREQMAARKIKATWDEQTDGPSWTLQTDIPHATFRIIEDGEVFGVGIVFRLADARLAPTEDAK